MNKPKNNLTADPVPPVLNRMTWPMIWGLLSMMLLNVIDTMYIGHLGPIPLTAISFTFPVVFLVTGTAMGMGVGASSVISRAFGREDLNDVRLLATNAITLALVFVLIIVVTGLVTLTPVFEALGADEEGIQLIRTYMVPFYFGVPFLVLPMVGNSVIRASGDTKTPSLIMILACVINLVLDPLLIFGLGPFPRLGLQGAAFATIIAYATTCFASLYILHFREHLLDYTWPGWVSIFSAWRRLLRVAAPAVGTNMMVPLAVGMLTRMIAGYGPNAVAAFGVGSRLESLAMCACFAFSSAFAAFAGQNFGAGRYDRVQEGIVYGRRFCFTVAFTLWGLMSAASWPIARLFTDVPEILHLVRIFIWIVPASYGSFGTLIFIAAAFNAHDMPMNSVKIYTLRLAALMLPLAYLGGHLAGPAGIFAGMMLANAGAGLYAWKLMQRHLDDLGAEPPSRRIPAGQSSQDFETSPQDSDPFNR